MSSEFSQEFWDAFGMKHGGIVMDCGCGRTHFTSDPNAGDFEEGELEGLEEKARTEPKRYINNGCDLPTAIDLAGYNYCYGCPCQYGPKLEAIVWALRRELAEYLAQRTNNLVRDLTKTRDAAQGASAQGGELG